MRLVATSDTMKHELERSTGDFSLKKSSGSRLLRILHVGKFYPPHMGGIETHLQTLCGELVKSFDVRVVVANDGPKWSDECVGGVPVHRVPTRLTFASTPLCPAMVGQIRRSDADIVHLHLPNPMAVLAYLASGHRGRVVVTYHSDTVRQRLLGAMFEPLLHQVLRRSSAIIVTSPNYLQTSAVLARHRDRCHVIPYGIRLEQFEHRDDAAVAALTRQYGHRLVISVGRLVYYKGFEYLIRAMSQVQGKLLIVGDGPLRRDLIQLSRTLGIEDKVIFVGEIQNDAVTPYYHASDVFALASVARSEAFGIVQIEAMAARLPVVNTNLDSGVPFVSLHAQTGLTVLPQDSGALAKAINTLLDDPQLRRQLGAAGHLRARQEFHLDVMVGRISALYEAVMSD